MQSHYGLTTSGVEGDALDCPSANWMPPEAAWDDAWIGGAECTLGKGKELQSGGLSPVHHIPAAGAGLFQVELEQPQA